MERGTAAALMLALLLMPAPAGAVSVHIVADQNQYEDGDTARLLVTLENTSDKPATGVRVENLLPKGLKYAPEQGETVFRHAVLAPHARVEHTLLVQRDPRVSVSEQSGLRVTLEADKERYADGETARLLVTAENRSGAPVTDLRLANLLPDGLEYAPEQGETSFSHARVAPGESVSDTLLVRQRVSQDVPRTGDRFGLAPLLAGCAASLAALLLLKKKKRPSAGEHDEGWGKDE